MGAAQAALRVAVETQLEPFQTGRIEVATHEKVSTTPLSCSLARILTATSARPDRLIGWTFRTLRSVDQMA